MKDGRLIFIQPQKYFRFLIKVVQIPLESTKSLSHDIDMQLFSTEREREREIGISDYYQF
jgi:hypothetical protein